MSEIKDRWEEIKETIKKEYDLSQVAYDTWIEPLEYYDEKDDVVNIIIPSNNSFSVTYINKRFKDYFKVTISEIIGKEINVNFVLNSNKEDNDESSVSNHTYNINYENANLNPKYKFDTFVVGSNNKFAHSASLAVAESPGLVYNPLFIYGGPGLGKTHLMHSIGHFILENNNTMKVLYVTSEEFTNEVIESIRSANPSSNMSKVRDKYRTVDVLMVDDVQFIIGKEATQEEFFNTFNTLHMSGKQIIISSDKPPKEMETLDERFRTRFEWGLIVDIKAPDYETRMAILRKNAENSNIKIDDSIIQYIANNVKSNIRELEGALTRIIAKAKANNDEYLTLDNAQNYLNDIVVPDKEKNITTDYIIQVVTTEFGVSYDDIVSSKRNSEISNARQTIMYLSRKMIDISLDNIGKILGNRDHTTVMHGIDNVEKKIKTDSEFKAKIDHLKDIINPQ